MLQQPVPSPLQSEAPTIFREAETGDIVITTCRMELRFTQLLRVGAMPPMACGAPNHEKSRVYWHVSIRYHRLLRAEFTSLGALPHAMLHTIQACARLGLLRSPRDAAKRYVARRYWHITAPNGRWETKLSCGCREFCTRHRPLLTVTQCEDKRYTTVCLGASFVDTNPLTLVRFIVGQLVDKHYLR